MPSVLNHLLQPLTYTAANGETRTLTSEDGSRVKNYVLAALMLAVTESLYSSRSLKSCVIIIVVTASVVFYIATAILKMLGRGESASSERNAEPVSQDLSRARSDPAELAKHERDMNASAKNLSATNKPDLKGDVDSQGVARPSSSGAKDKKRDDQLSSAEIKKRQQAAFREQDEQLDAIYGEAKGMHAKLAALEKKASDLSSSASRPQQPAPQPVRRKDPPPPRQESPSVPTVGLSLPPILGKAYTTIFGEEDFSKKPAWVDDPQYKKVLQRAYFASLWKRMYEGGVDVFVHEMEFSDNDEKLRLGNFPIASGTPWVSFAEHARKKLVEEWDKKGPLRKTLSPYVPFL